MEIETNLRVGADAEVIVDNLERRFVRAVVVRFVRTLKKT